MDFNFTDEQNMLRDTVAKFVTSTTLTPAARS